MFIGGNNSVAGYREKSKDSEISVTPQYATVWRFVKPKMWGLVEDNVNGKRMNLRLEHSLGFNFFHFSGFFSLK